MIETPKDWDARIKKAKVLYVVGTAVFFSSTLIVFGAMALAPASILAPIESVQFVANIGFARVVNKVKLSIMMIVSSFAIVGGVAIAIGFGNHKNKSLVPDDLIGYWQDGTWIGYLIGLLVVAVIVQATWFVYNKAEKAGAPLPGSGALLPSAYALSSSMIGSISVLQAKCISELLECMGNGIGVWDEWMTYLVLGLFLVTVGFWLYRLNSALGLYDPLFIIPAIQAGYIFWATMSASVYFQDFKYMEPYQIALFATGMGIMLAGLTVLSQASAKLERANHPEAAAPGAAPEAKPTRAAGEKPPDEVRV